MRLSIPIARISRTYEFIHDMARAVPKWSFLMSGSRLFQSVGRFRIAGWVMLC